ncbi:MAG: hypothetical protein ACRD6B_15885 [Bryobacteraceae bacterium]
MYNPIGVDAIFACCICNTRTEARSAAQLLSQGWSWTYGTRCPTCQPHVAIYPALERMEPA